jgi:hypothetical protein
VGANLEVGDVAVAVSTAGESGGSEIRLGPEKDCWRVRCRCRKSLSVATKIVCYRCHNSKP